MPDRPHPISEKALNFVGLTPEDLQLVRQQDEQELDREILYADGNGGSFYLQRLKSPDDYITIYGLGRKIRFENSVKLHEIPSKISGWLAIEFRPYGLSESFKSKTTTYLRGFVEGFGKAAFKIEDWESAVNAYHEITSGGILESETFRQMVRDLDFGKPRPMHEVQPSAEEVLRKKQKAQAEIAEAISAAVNSHLGGFLSHADMFSVSS